MNKFEKINNILFAILFAIIAVAELAGFFAGKTWCIALAILCALLSIVLFREAFNNQKKQAK